jgi:hypothetical protein
MSNEKRVPPLRTQRVYELAGAPSLLFRGQESTTRFAEPLLQENMASALQEYLQARRRIQARWYYPIDHHVLSSTLQSLSKAFSSKIGRRRRAFERQGSGDAATAAAVDCGNKGEADAGSNNNNININNSNDAKGEESNDSGKDESRRVPKRKQGAAAKKTTNTAFVCRDYFGQQSLPILQQARKHALLSLDEDDTMESTNESHGVHQRRLEANQIYDASYVPGRVRAKANKRQKQTANGLMPKRVAQTLQLSLERQNYGDPAFLAPFHTESLEETTLDDKVSLAIEDDALQSGSVARRRRTPAILKDDPNSPTVFGNCIVVTACLCSICKGKGQHSWCLLYPVGELLDTVRLSFLGLPLAGSSTTTFPEAAELDVGDGVKQLIRCSTDTFAARTSTHVSIFRLIADCTNQAPTGSTRCCKTVNLEEIHRIDARSMSRSTAAYYPRDIAVHPKYGDGWTDPKIAILYESDRNQRNIIRLVSVSPSPSMSDHCITNLQDIFAIDFSPHHPMVLLASGRSHVRPVLTADLFSNNGPKQYRVGHGSSLFSIDLRSNEATFQWSPSAEEFVTEGIHSLSGIQTDWAKENTVLVSSVSAGKTWEIDVRVPYRTINAWSLPGSCDEGDTTLPVTGIHGAGILFAQPSTFTNVDNSLTSRPILSVGKSPETFGLNIYQRPDVKPRFQTQSVECTSCPGLVYLGAISVATSSVYALPDVSNDVFTCGLATLRTPTAYFFSSESLQDLGFAEKDTTGVLCAITMTNKGDIYTHTMLESKSGYTCSKLYDELPIGASALAIPDGAETPALDLKCFALQISLRNEFPFPSGVKFRTSPQSRGGYSLPDPVVLGGTVDAEPSLEVQPTAPCHAIVSRRGVINESIQLPVRLLQTSSASTVDCFHHERKSVVETDEFKVWQQRSDITANILSSKASRVQFDDECAL